MANAPAGPSTLANIDIQVNLPELPPSLKHLSPYIQRSIELKKKDPIMCYWCLYFAAKQGVAAKGGKETRPFLFAVLELLEKTKTILVQHSDAVASDEAGSAYIENFALKLFNMADNEDRKGRASKSTAKKFLAAANFLELLSVFDVPDQTENEQKIRYSKWKAADVAKAIREGRQPTPGPAGSSFEDTMNAIPGVPSGAVSPTPSAPHAGVESTFGSIPPSISASPNRHLPPLPTSPVKRPAEEIEPEQDTSKLFPHGAGEDVTPVSSPRRAKKALSPERPAADGAGTRNISRSMSPPSRQHASSKELSPNSYSIHASTSSPGSSGTETTPSSAPSTKAAPHTPTAIKTGLAPGSMLKPGASPGGWSTIATPGMDDRSTPIPPPAKNNADSGRKIGGFLSRLYGAASGGSHNDAAKNGQPAHGNGNSNGTVENGNGHIVSSYVVEEPNDDDDDDAGSITGTIGATSSLPPVHPSHHRISSEPTKRQDSWGSTHATRGDLPSRSGSWSYGTPTSPRFGDDDEEGSEVNGDVRDIKIIPKEHSSRDVPAIALPSAPPLDAEASDILSPLPPPTNGFNAGLLPIKKSVHFTPSVVGGLSSIASSSPPASPSGTIGSRIPLPASDSEDTASIDEQHTFITIPPLPPSPSEEPVEEYRVPSTSTPGTSSGVGAAANPTASVKTSPPRLPTVPLLDGSSSSSSSNTHTNGNGGGARNHSRTPSGATEHLEAPDAGRSPSPNSLSPRLRATVVPPISATGRVLAGASTSSGSGSNGVPRSPPLLPSHATGGGVPDVKMTPPSLQAPPTSIAAPAPNTNTSSSTTSAAPSAPVSTPKYPPTPYHRVSNLALSPSQSPATTPSTPSPALPIPPPVPAAPHSHVVSHPPPPPPTSPLPLPDILDAEETTRAKRHAKFAISALDYDDLDTARKELVAALKILGVNVAL